MNPQHPVLQGVTAMQCNVGTTDKIIRLVVGVVIVIAGLYYQNWLGVIGLVPILTALVGYCPAYSLFGASTSKSQDQT
jgi:hypothetical protein